MDDSLTEKIQSYLDKIEARTPNDYWGDPTNPSYYKRGKIEAIEAIESSMSKEQFLGYLKGNTLKYIWRFDRKNNVEDLKKAIWYLNRMLDKIETDGEGE